MNILIVYALFTLMIHVEGNSDVSCPTPLCQCQYLQAICSGENLTYIPRLPDKIRYVTFINGNIGILLRERIGNLTFNHIEKLKFTSNRIFGIKPNTFANLTWITRFTLSSEHSLDVFDVRYALIDIGTRSRYLKKVFLIAIGLTVLPNDMFKSLKTSKIDTISLKSNNITILNCLWFSDLKQLVELDVRSNQITHVIPGMMQNLRILSLNHNDLNRLPNFCIDHEIKSAFPNLLKLDISSNKILTLGQIRCLPSLQSLIIGNNLIRVIHSDTFSNLQQLTRLGLMAVGKPLKKIEEGALNISSLKTLSLRKCNFYFYKLSSLALSKIFSSCQNLESIDLGGNVINSGSTVLTPLISPLTKLRNLNLQATKINSLPEYTFTNMQYIKTIILSENRIYSWHGPRVFGNMTSLIYIDLGSNLITIIDETSFPPSLLKNLEKISLAFNRFSCTCEQMWFLNWLQKTNTSIVSYPQKYYCTQPANFNHVLLKYYNPTVESCTPWNPFFTTVILISTFGILVIASCGFFLKCHTNMKNYVYLLRVKHRKRYGYLPIESSDTYEYHAFVVYCDSNRTWVHNEFVKRLETEEGLKFCIHHRDFVAGDTISANVDNFLKESWKVVVIMSNALAKSEWCQWEIDIVQERRRRQGRDALVLIMLENINSKNMTSPLRTLLDSTPFIRYKKGIGEDLFWKAVVEGLRKSIGQPPVSLL
ncbi:toll-like receptor 13 [Mytilus californianus]|uniref:toll-like receptor 13 n=1 Tax=Mytilus californianus TaxID=6549 RepID=UPI002245EFB0|nr:toll-like receptor 13 [Mytilus californianus]